MNCVTKFNLALIIWVELWVQADDPADAARSCADLGYKYRRSELISQRTGDSVDLDATLTILDTSNPMGL